MSLAQPDDHQHTLTTTTASTPARASCATRRSSARATSAPAARRRPTSSAPSSAPSSSPAFACSTSAAGSAARRSTSPSDTARRSPASTSLPRWSPSAWNGPRMGCSRLGSLPGRRHSRGDVSEPFDVIWSRDALMHLHDKPRLFARLLDLLAPGGQLIVTDYARGIGAGSPEFQAYVKSTGYHLVDPAATASCSRTPASST